MELWGLFLSAFISATLAPGGSEAVLAYLTTTGKFSVSELLAVATAGNTLGAVTTWALGLLAAQKFPAASLLPQKKQKALEVIASKGIWALFFSWLPVIGDALCFAAGWLRLPFFKGAFIIMLGKFCRYLVVIWMFL
jgi:membrane protein YqaA with SNARE-associated domain